MASRRTGWLGMIGSRPRSDQEAFDDQVAEKGTGQGREQVLRLNRQQVF
jgi:hypothetical protein